MPMFTDKLKSYRVERRKLALSIRHLSHKGLNNRLKNIYIFARKCERIMYCYTLIGCERIVSVLLLSETSSSHPPSSQPLLLPDFNINTRHSVNPTQYNNIDEKCHSIFSITISSAKFLRIRRGIRKKKTPAHGPVDLWSAAKAYTRTLSTGFHPDHSAHDTPHPHGTDSLSPEFTCFYLLCSPYVPI